jgi:hypothetical protein
MEEVVAHGRAQEMGYIGTDVLKNLVNDIKRILLWLRRIIT